MSWIAVALVGHLANGVAFAVDKILLRTAFTRSATYAGIVGLLSAFALVLWPFVDVWPSGNAFALACISGITFILALWTFFGALARAEASRVVPIVGSLIPIITLIGAYSFLGERLTHQTLIGFTFLIVATVLLSRGGAGRPTGSAVTLSLVSAILFAVASLTAKSVYDTSGFLGTFLLTRVCAAATSLFMLSILDRRAGQEVLSMLHPTTRTSTHRSAALLALVGQTVGSAGFVCVQWATAQGSASIVNAMQAIQYALLVLVAFVLRTRAPQLLGERLTTHTLILKSIALALTAIGLALIV